MDSMQIKSAFMRYVISMALTRYIKKKFGPDIAIDVQNIDASFDGDNVTANLNLAIVMDKNEVSKLLAKI